MLVTITNTPRDYAWGSRTAIGELLGRPSSGGPEAELWLGAHGASPAVVTDATPAYAGRRLDQLVAERPDAFVGAGRTRLPFLMKVLAADQPLSLQAHPDVAQAAAGFARERDAGTPDGERNYVDDTAKPELILALSPTFEALAGFRHVSESRMLVAELAGHARGEERSAIVGLADRLAAGDPVRSDSSGSSQHVLDHGIPEEKETSPSHSGGGNALEDVTAWLLRGGSDVDRLVAAVTAAADRARTTSSYGREWETVADLAGTHPGDAGIVLALLLNRVSLRQGQALALPARSMHAYLRGVGIEVMSPSDNVIRGGLTTKRIDVDELLKVVDFQAASPSLNTGEQIEDGLVVYRATTEEFVLAKVTVGEAGAVHGYRLTGPDQAAFILTGPAIVLCVAGALSLRGRLSSGTLARGDAVLVTPDEGTLTFEGSGLAFLTTTP